jgi:hypothetical protein
MNSMERKTREITPNKTKDDVTDFVRENALVKETDNKPALSNKGEKVLQGLEESLGAVNSNPAGAQ